MSILKTALISFIIAIITPLYSQDALSLVQVREKYFNNNEKTCTVLELIRVFDNRTPKNPVIKAYYGASYAAAPQCISSVSEKLSFFKIGKSLINNAVIQEPANFEVRFLRFATQVKAPRFLGYNNDIDDDKKFLISNLEAGNIQFKGSSHFKTILKFLINSRELDQSEKQTVNSYL